MRPTLGRGIGEDRADEFGPDTFALVVVLNEEPYLDAVSGGSGGHRMPENSSVRSSASARCGR
jgi:hypothetical protein